jgi:glycosyltransferase involved in cell wall biosynthesis
MDLLSIRHVSFSNSGGAGRVAETLSSNLLRLGHDSQFVHVVSGGIRSAALKHPGLFLSGLIDFFFVRLEFSQSLFSLYRNGSVLNADTLITQLIHLHWTPGTVSLSDMHHFSKLRLPVIWTIHDMFPFTGGCHHANDCVGYKFSCSGCPQVRPIFRKPVEKSLTAKIDMTSSSRAISIVTPSNWLGNKAKESRVFENSPVWVIPNPIDTDLFKPATFSKVKSERKLTVGCNATNLLDPMKGVASIISVLETVQIYNPDVEIELLAIGGGKLPSSRIRIRQSGFVSDQMEIVKLYQEMDVFVSMSLAEVFPLSIAEAQSCGLPVICLNTGGMPEMVDQGINGFVVESSENLLHQLNYFCGQEINSSSMGVASRLNAVSQYSTNVVVKKYIDLYAQVLAL